MAISLNFEGTPNFNLTIFAGGMHSLERQQFPFSKLEPAFATCGVCTAQSKGRSSRQKGLKG